VGLAEELKPGVTGRVPGRINRDDRYFQDVFQGMPAQGYAAMFETMLASPNIDILLGCNCPDIQREVQATAYCTAVLSTSFWIFASAPCPTEAAAPLTIACASAPALSASCTSEVRVHAKVN
jgi:UDP-galactopyranose mutase